MLLFQINKRPCQAMASSEDRLADTAQSLQRNKLLILDLLSLLLFNLGSSEHDAA